jgi:hypothetical protein
MPTKAAVCISLFRCVLVQPVNLALQHVAMLKRYSVSHDVVDHVLLRSCVCVCVCVCCAEAVFLLSYTLHYAFQL